MKPLFNNHISAPLSTQSMTPSLPSIPPNQPRPVSRREWLIAAASAGAVLTAPAGSGAAEISASKETQIGARVYNIRTFAAKGTAQPLDTPAVQAAIDACAKESGGTVLVPAGDFVVGTLELK